MRHALLPMEAVVSHMAVRVPRLAAPPSPSVGRYVDTGDNVDYFYDDGRSKWLSVARFRLDFSFSTTHVGASFMATNYVSHAATRGFSFARLATVVGVQLREGSGGTATLQLLRNAGAVSSDDLGAPNANGDLFDMALDIDVVSVTDSGLYPYTLYVDGAGGNELGTLFYQWRQS